MSASRAQRPAAHAAPRLIELSGQAMHTFRFPATLDLSYEYFCDVPAVFRLLPDALDVRAYGPDRYRLIVGASDGHGHSMSAIFDLIARYEPGHSIRVLPADDGPPVKMPGLVFSGALAAHAVFAEDAHGTAVRYTVDLAMDIPVPGVLKLMPESFLQALGERAMEYKMTQMISGFTENIAADFAAWARS
jgi:hypothetical protein